MSIDIEYLLFLQELRNATGGAFDEFFNAISKIAVDIMPLLPYLIYWAVDKKWGYRFIGALWGGELLNGIIKLTVCAYRPWIRDVRVEPAGDSKVAATGYSFPSGHTMCATATYGTTAVWQHKKRKWLTALCVIMVLLTAFSRNFLGVHTPQDVVVGLLETSFVVFIVGVIQNKVSGNEKLADILTVCGVLAVIGALIYIQLKSYPMDYVEGNLLVDPEKMKNDTFRGAGGFLGLMIGSYMERHYIKYDVPKNFSQLPVFACVGTAAIYCFNTYFYAITFKQWFGAHWGGFISAMLMMLFVVVLYPTLITKAAKSQNTV